MLLQTISIPALNYRELRQNSSGKWEIWKGLILDTLSAEDLSTLRAYVGS